MECYLASYKDDGMCVEGVGYWAFGFGFFASYAMLEKEITGGEVDWFARPKVKEIAKFLQKTFLQRDVLVTFSDSSVKQKYFFSLPHMLRSVYGDEIEPLPPDLGLVVEDNTHFNFALRSIIYYSKDNLSDGVRNDVTYASEGSSYFFKRKGDYGFAAKGGNNGESHNHIDVGTFIIARNNKQIIADVGAGPYEEGYHTDKRYTFFNPSAYAHSIPLFDGVGEDDIRRDDVVVFYDETSERASMDIAIAYGKDFVRSVKREFAFYEDKITLSDTFDLSEKKQITERFITLCEPKLIGGVLAVDGTYLVPSKKIAPTVTEKVLKAHISGEYSAYIVDYVLPEGDNKFEISFEMRK